jgi:hypothetical protein
MHLDTVLKEYNRQTDSEVLHKVGALVKGKKKKSTNYAVCSIDLPPSKMNRLLEGLIPETTTDLSGKILLYAMERGSHWMGKKSHPEKKYSAPCQNCRIKWRNSPEPSS